MSKDNKTKSIPAASLKLLAGVAPLFDMPIKVARADGSTVALTLKVKGMRKSEWAAIRDENLAVLRAKGEQQEGEFSFAKMGAGAKDAADLITKAATGWDLEDDLTVANIEEMEDIMPGSISAILGAIDAALFHGRSGN